MEIRAAGAHHPFPLGIFLSAVWLASEAGPTRDEGAPVPPSLSLSLFSYYFQSW